MEEEKERKRGTKSKDRKRVKMIKKGRLSLIAYVKHCNSVPRAQFEYTSGKKRKETGWGRGERDGTKEGRDKAKDERGTGQDKRGERDGTRQKRREGRDKRGKARKGEEKKGKGKEEREGKGEEERDERREEQREMKDEKKRDERRGYERREESEI